MGKRGPAGRPTNIALLHGERSSRINTDEPMPADGDPTLPYDMTPDAEEVWDAAVEQLRVMKVLTPADSVALAAYCEAVVTLNEITAKLRDSDVIILNAKGDAYVKNPLVAMQRDYIALVRVMAREFGLTPSARSDIHVGKPNTGAGIGPERLLG